MKIYRYCRRLHGRRGLKFDYMLGAVCAGVSPPSRAAWIEIMYYDYAFATDHVAAFTGGVD